MIKHLMVQIEELPEGGFMATSEDFPDLLAYATTASEALENAKDVAQKLVDSYLEHGDALPYGCDRMRLRQAITLESARIT